MPVKVRCPQCQAVMAAPDAARGKAVRCKNCQGKVPVPAAGDGAPSAAKAAAKPKSAGKSAAPGKPKPQSAPALSADDEDFLARLDLSRLEDTSVRVCPKCGTELGEEDVDCSNCGVNYETGQLGAAARKALRKKQMKGPDPADFYAAAWSDSWNFLKNNLHIPLKMGLGWTALQLSLMGSAFMVSYCERIPLIVFWGFLALLFALGNFGIFWYVAIEIVTATLQRQDEIKSLRFDLFSIIALGVKGVVWSYVVLLPILVVAAMIMFPMGFLQALVTGSPLVAGLILASIYLMPIFVFPIAIVHMSMPYTYKAWLPVDLVRILLKNFPATLYWVLVAVVVHLPILTIVLPLVTFLADDVLLAVMKLAANLIMWMTGLVGSPAEIIVEPGQYRVSEQTGGFLFSVFSMFTWSLIAALFIAPFTMGSAFSAVFAARAIGLFGYYNYRTLEIVTQTKANEPCGFWVRYLAFLVDNLILGIFIGLIFAGLLGVGKVLLTLGLGAEMLGPLGWAYYAACAIIPFLYYLKQESGTMQATLGKQALGIIVTTMEGKTISQGQAASRFVLRLFSFVLLGVPFIAAAFTPKKQTFHDQLTKTLVVWKGDAPG